MNRLISVMLFYLFFTTSCNRIQNDKYDLFEDHEREIVLKHKISKINEILIGLDSLGIPLFKRIEKIKFYNKEGLLSMEIEPLYEKKPDPHENDPLYILKQSFYKHTYATNIPKGESYIIIYEYDKLGNLTSKKELNSLTTYKYDTNNNCIERCIKYGIGETNCKYSIFKYNSDNQIITKLDSFSMHSIQNGRKWNTSNRKFVYEYDKSGRVIYDGEARRVFNDQNQLIEVKFDGDQGTIISFFYDKDGHRVKQTRPEKYLANTYFLYNEKGLLSEKKILDINKTLVELKRFEYVYY